MEDEFAEEEMPMADAGTDAVPADSLEDPGADPALAPNAEDMNMAQSEPAAVPEGVQDEFQNAFSETAQSDATASADAAPAMAAPVAMSGSTQGYMIQRGDTLMKIAFETYGDLYQWKKIYEMNRDKIPDPNNLVAGVQLTLEQPMSPVSIERNGERYLIKSGDTLGTISRDVYGTSGKWKRLWENNSQLIRDPNKIYAGFYLYYTFTPEDEQEKSQYSQPLAGGMGAPASDRAPASADAMSGDAAMQAPGPEAGPAPGAMMPPGASAQAPAPAAEGQFQ